MKHRILLITVFLLASCVARQPYIPQGVQTVGEYKQGSTGLTFPEKVNEFIRVGITQYDEQATDIGVGYNHPTKKIVLTLYSYPAPQIISFGSPKEVIDDAKNNLFNQAYQGSKQDILYGHKNSTLVTEGKYQFPKSGIEHIGMHAVFKYSEQFAGRVQVVESHLYLIQIRERLMKYRVTYPENTHADREIARFIESFVLRENT